MSSADREDQFIPADLASLDAAEALEQANGRRWVGSLSPLARAEATGAGVDT